MKHASMRSRAWWIAVVAGSALVAAFVLRRHFSDPPAGLAPQGDASRQGATLSVLVRDLDGAPLRGAQVIATRSRLRTPLPGGEIALSDATGRARFASLEPGEWVVHLESFLWRGIALARGDTAEIGFTVPSIGRVEGVVVDESGAPVAGAAVLTHKDRAGEPREVARSGTDGRFAFDVVAISGPVHASHPGFVPSLPRHAEAMGAETVALRLELGRSPCAVHGVTLDAGGRAVTGARVVATRRDGRTWRSRSDDRGRFALDDVLAGRLSVDAFTPEHGLAQTSVVVPQSGLAGLELRLDASLGLEGYVVTESGIPVAGAHVLVALDSEQLAVRSDEEGRVVIPGLAQGRHRVDIDYLDRPRLHTWADVGDAASGSTRFVIEDAVLLRGEIVDEFDRPLPDLLVADDEWESAPITDARGAFVLLVPVRGAHIEIYAPGFLATPLLPPEFVEPSNAVSRIVVPSSSLPSAHIRGIVKRPETYEDQPLRVTLWHEWNKYPSVFLSVPKDGVLRFGPLPPGRYSLRTDARDTRFGPTWLAEFALSPGQDADLGELSVPDPVVPELRVRANDGRKITELRAFLVPRGNHRIIVDVGLRDGHTTWAGPLAAGVYRLLVDDGEGYRGTEQLVTLRAGPPNVIELVLQAW